MSEFVAEEESVIKSPVKVMETVVALEPPIMHKHKHIVDSYAKISIQILAIEEIVENLDWHLSISELVFPIKILTPVVPCL